MTNILGIVVFLLIISTIVLFTLEGPYWYYSILPMIVLMIIIITKVTWNIAGWADKAVRRWSDANLAPDEDDEKK